LRDERGVDLIIDVDFGVNLSTSTALIGDGGTIASYASMGAPTPAYPFYALATRNINIRNVLVYSMSNDAKRAAIDDIAQWAATGNATFAIAHRFPLVDISTAHETV
jgi:NADPH2:quinone reductase